MPDLRGEMDVIERERRAEEEQAGVIAAAADDLKRQADAARQRETDALAARRRAEERRTAIANAEAEARAATADVARADADLARLRPLRDAAVPAVTTARLAVDDAVKAQSELDGLRQALATADADVQRAVDAFATLGTEPPETIWRRPKPTMEEVEIQNPRWVEWDRLRKQLVAARTEAEARRAAAAAALKARELVAADLATRQQALVAAQRTLDARASEVTLAEAARTAAAMRGTDAQRRRQDLLGASAQLAADLARAEAALATANAELTTHLANKPARRPVPRIVPRKLGGDGWDAEPGDADDPATDAWFARLAELRIRVDAAQQAVEQARARLVSVPTPDDEIAQYAASAAAAHQEADALSAQERGRRQEYQAALAAAAQRAETRLASLRPLHTARPADALLIGDLAANAAIALLPVRLETRFAPRTPAGPAVDLLVRIYPDELHVDAHEPTLTEDEDASAKQFWRQTWNASRDGTRQEAAWEQLVSRFGAPRAAFIANELRPTNAAEWPTPGTAPAFPALRLRTTGAWTSAPRVRALPTRWVVIGYRGGASQIRAFVAWANPTPPSLAAGPAPKTNSDPTTIRTEPRLPRPEDSLPFGDPGLRWMVDFAAAEIAGMAVRIPLTAEQAAGLDRVVALGVRGADTARTEFAALLTAQRYTRGLEFLPQGTPTNNTADASPATVPLAADGRPRLDGAPSPGDTSNAAVASALLGLDRGFLSRLGSAAVAEQIDARAMNNALWAATWGYALGELLPESLSPAALERVRAHFVQHVRARGPLPALRIGRQPYGILPVTSLEKWQPRTGGTDAAGLTESDAAELARILKLLREAWLRCVALVPNVAESAQERGVAAGTDTRDRREFELLAALRMSPLSMNYAITAIATPAGMQTKPGAWVKADAVAPAARAALAALGLASLRQPDAASPLVAVAAHLAGGSFDGPIVWPRPFDRAALTQAQPQDPSLLYLLLRHAAQRDQHVAEFDASLTHLATLSAAALQRALAEALDLASHRLDAWTTSLATRRLARMSMPLPSAPYVGGYGWVEHLTPRPRGAAVPAPDDARRSASIVPGNGGFVHAPSLPQAATAAVLRSGFLARRGTGGDNPLAVNLSSQRVRLATAVLDGIRQGQPLAVCLGYRFERALHDAHLDQYIAPFRRLVPLSAAAGDALARAAAAVERAEAAYRSAAATAADHEAAYRAAAPLIERTTRELALTTEVETRESEVATIRQDLVRHRAREPLAKNFLALAKGGGGPIGRASDDYLDAMEVWQTILAEMLARLAAAQESLARVAAERDALTRAPRRSVPIIDAELSRFKADQDASYKAWQAGLAAARAAEAERTVALNAYAAITAALFPPGAERIQPTTVVDGDQLRQRFRAGLARERAREQTPWSTATVPFGEPALGLPAVTSDDGKRLYAALQDLDEVVDAVADATVAEAVHQMVQGNSDRASATLDAIVAGAAPPPDLDIVRTPRSGVAQTHRLLVLFGDKPRALPKWPGTATSARARVEPRLNAWVGELVGNPARVQCTATYVDAKGTPLATPKPLPIRLSDLKLAPLDVVFMADAGDRAQQGELEQRLRYFALRKLPATVDADVRLAFERGPAFPQPARGTAELLSVSEFSEVLRAVRALVKGARAIDGRDLGLPQSSADAAIKLDDLRTRGDAARAALQDARTALIAATDPQPMRDALLRMADFGIAGAVPQAARGDTVAVRASLHEQAQRVAAEAGRRLDRIAERTAAFEERVRDAGTAALPIDVTVGYWLGVIEDVFGGDFRTLPLCAPANRAEFAATLANSAKLLTGFPSEPLRWFQRAARVREGAARLDRALAYAQAVGSPAVFDLRVAQLPHVAKDRWIALPFENKPRSAAQLSMVVHLPHAVTKTEPLAGLLIDEWVDVVPNAAETTGLAFHFDEPNARAPQAILLAVPPDAAPKWTIDALERTVFETLDLAKLRAVDAGVIADAAVREQSAGAAGEVSVTAIDHLLPALYFEGSAIGQPPAPPVTTPPVSNAVFLGQQVPQTMIAGKSYNVSITFRNTGTTTWTNTGATPFRLGSQKLPDNLTWGTSRFELPAGVAPGGEVTLSAAVVAPAEPGAYAFQWQMLQEPTGWFGAATEAVTVTVTRPAATYSVYGKGMAAGIGGTLL